MDGETYFLPLLYTDIVASSMDSDLEAFSHNPADGSFAAVPDQTAAKTNYPNERFLSY